MRRPGAGTAVLPMAMALPHRCTTATVLRTSTIRITTTIRSGTARESTSGLAATSAAIGDSVATARVLRGCEEIDALVILSRRNRGGGWLGGSGGGRRRVWLGYLHSRRSRSFAPPSLTSSLRGCEEIVSRDGLRGRCERVLRAAALLHRVSARNGGSGRESRSFSADPSPSSTAHPI